ncbi:hypothetical protein [Streptomyces sp. NPDC047928]|uniref:hypothetical protein n=1 Tax=unclassified Streptomyces TaxID=2593676 RepID=UPI003722C774
MPLHVHVPLRVQLVEPVTARELTLLEKAVGDACRRALETARREVVDVRGSGRPVVIHHEPAVFTGLSPAEGVREHASEAVRRGLEYAVSASGLLRRRGTPAARTGVPAEEPLDPVRVAEDEAGTTYRIPSYDHSGEGVAVPFLHRQGDRKDWVYLPFVGEVLSIEQAATAAWLAHLDRHGAVWQPDAHGHPGYAGLVAYEGRDVPALVWISGVTRILPDGSLPKETYDRTCQTFPLLRWQQTGPGARSAVPLAGGLAPYHDLVRTEQAGTVEAIGRLVLRLLDEARERADHPLRDADARRGYAEKLLEEARGPSVLCEVRGDRKLFAVMKDTIPARIRFVTAVPRPAAAGAPPAPGAVKAGTRAGQGARPRKPSWPKAVTGETLGCRAYDGEPEWRSLPRSADRLGDGIRHLARLLDVPECAYAGMFTLNCARVISARAHAVGMASVRSTVTTQVTVRGDGKGNNGYLHLRPGEAPELGFMRRLAEAAAAVRELADEVTLVYQLPDNAPRVRPGGGGPVSHAAGWSLGFLKEVHATLTDGCTYLYAETCRVLLLQQLRSSRTAIAQRRGPHARETLRHFSQVLDVLGGSVVKLQVLLNALRHAERTGVTGSVRTVLSVRERQYRPGDREHHMLLPPPISHVSARTLAELADSRIERGGAVYLAVHGGRNWTAADLEAGVNARRALVNQVDPLFFQIGNLEEVFTAVQRDPAAADAFLRNLLAQMAKANQEMTHKASEPEGGAFFALETSRWIEVEGGRDERGLWFHLSGIHAMADAELRPHTGALREYTDAVNLAIGRKYQADTVRKLAASAGVLVLGLLCAPLGAAAAGLITGAASVSLAIADHLDAQEKGRLYQSVMDPEALQSWQEVQAEQLSAAIGLAFSVFDAFQIAGGAKAIVGRAAQVWKVGRRAGRQMAVASVRRGLVANMADELLKHALGQAATQAMVMQVMDEAMTRLVGPVVQEWAREQGVQHGTWEPEPEPGAEDGED